MQKIGLDVPKSALVSNLKDGLEFAGKIGFPVIVRPSFTLGGRGRGMLTTAKSWWKCSAAVLISLPCTKR